MVAFYLYFLTRLINSIKHEHSFKILYFHTFRMMFIASSNTYPFEPRRREKTCLRGFANNIGAEQPAHSRRLISAFVIHVLESTISNLAKSEISRLQPHKNISPFTFNTTDSFNTILFHFRFTNLSFIFYEFGQLGL